MDTEPGLTLTAVAELLDDVERAETTRIRTLRDRCRAEERRLSYVRRMVQGHLDLAVDELARRGDAPAEALEARVTRTLTTPAPPARSLRAVGLYAPGGTADDLHDVAPAPLPDLDDVALVDHVEHLRRRERTLSDRRAVLLGHLDRLQAVLVRRYRDDATALDEVALTLGGT